ncbi:hypothetical protein PSPO01_15339 [Paraphaeosphaeria sporulosa]
MPKTKPKFVDVLREVIQFYDDYHAGHDILPPLLRMSLNSELKHEKANKKRRRNQHGPNTRRVIGSMVESAPQTEKWDAAILEAGIQPSNIVQTVESAPTRDYNSNLPVINQDKNKPLETAMRNAKATAACIEHAKTLETLRRLRLFLSLSYFSVLAESKWAPLQIIVEQACGLPFVWRTLCV